MADELQWVSLKGGSCEGEIRKAPPPPVELHVDFVQIDGGGWSELYVYDGTTVDHPEYGAVPVMVCSEGPDLPAS